VCLFSNKKGVILTLFCTGPGGEYLATYAAAAGSVEILQWLLSKGRIDKKLTQFTWDISGIAAKHGHLRVLKWLKTNDMCSRTINVEVIAERGYLDVLRWAVENYYQEQPPPIIIITAAATQGHVRILDYAFTHWFNSNHYHLIAEAGKQHIHVLMWAKWKGFIQ
jgi:hypothetical protein